MDIWRKWRNPKQKPPFVARIDWSDPITEGLVGCWLFNETLGKFYNAISGNSCVVYNSNAYLDGNGLCISSSDAYADTEQFTVNTGSKWTCFSISIQLYQLNDYQILVQQLDGSGTGRSWLHRESNGNLCAYLGGALLDSGKNIPLNNDFSACVVSAGNAISIYFNGDFCNKNTVTIEYADGNFRFGNHKRYITHGWYGVIKLTFLWHRVLVGNEIERLHYEPYSFFLIPAARIFDLAPASGGQTYSYEGNIPLSLSPSHVKEVRYYPPLGGAPIVLTPQGQVRASYQKEGLQQISLTPQADIKATYVKDGLVLMQIALAAEKQAKYFAAGEIPISLQVQSEKRALYEKSGVLSFSLLPFSRVQATYAKEGSVSFSLALESDIACTFRVEGSVGFILLPQGSWTYVPVTGGAVYTYEGNIPIALAPEADVKALYKKQGGLFLSLSPASSWQAKYRHVGELLLSLIPAGEKQASFLIEGEIQLHLVPEGVAVVIKPSGQEELFVVGIIEEDDLRAVFDGAVHGDIWPRK